MEIIVISLARAEERRRLMRAQLELPGMPPYRFVDAVDARALARSELESFADQAAALRHCGRRLTATEIACAESHLRVYKGMLARRAPAAVILEDDALVSHQFASVVARVLERLDRERPQVVLLSQMDRYSAWGGRRLDRLHRLCRPYEAYGGHAYVINAAGAERLLAALRPIHAVADDWRHVARFVELRGLVPYLVGTSPLSNDSQIGQERFELRAATRIPSWLHKYAWRRFIFQLVVKPALRLHRDRKTW